MFTLAECSGNSLTNRKLEYIARISLHLAFLSKRIFRCDGDAPHYTNGAQRYRLVSDIHRYTSANLSLQAPIKTKRFHPACSLPGYRMLIIIRSRRRMIWRASFIIENMKKLVHRSLEDGMWWRRCFQVAHVLDGWLTSYTRIIVNYNSWVPLEAMMHSSQCRTRVTQRTVAHGYNYAILAPWGCLKYLLNHAHEASSCSEFSNNQKNCLDWPVNKWTSFTLFHNKSTTRCL